MPDNDLKIKITTTADTSGAKQTADALKNLTSEAKSLPPVLDSGTKSTEKMTVAKGRLKEQFRELRHAVPELSSVFAALTHPMTAVVALFGVAAVAIRKYIAEVNEAAEATAGFSAWSRGAIQTARLAREGAREAASFAESLKDTATAADRAKESLARVNTELEKQLRNQNELQDAEMALQLEKVKASQDRGELTPTQALEQSVGIRNRFAAEKVQREQQAKFQAGDVGFARAQQLRGVAAEAAAATPGAQAEVERQRVIAAQAEAAFSADTGAFGKQRSAEVQKVKDAEGVLDYTIYADTAPAWTPVGMFRRFQRRRATNRKEEAESRITDIDRQIEQAGILRDQRAAGFTDAQKRLSALGTVQKESLSAAEAISFSAAQVHAEGRGIGGQFAKLFGIQGKRDEVAIASQRFADIQLENKALAESTKKLVDEMIHASREIRRIQDRGVLDASQYR